MQHWEAIVRGLHILADANDGNISVQAEHDEIFAEGDIAISHTDHLRMTELGWSTEDNLLWSIYV